MNCVGLVVGLGVGEVRCGGWSFKREYIGEGKDYAWRFLIIRNDLEFKTYSPSLSDIHIDMLRSDEDYVPLVECTQSDILVVGRRS